MDNRESKVPRQSATEKRPGLVKPPPAAKPRRRAQHERSAETTLKLITATIDCIAKYSYAQTTTALIADMSGFTRGALQHHFESREDLILAVWHHVHEKFSAAHDLPIKEDQDLTTTVGLLIDRLWNIYSSADYLAATEIRLGARANRKLAKRLCDDVQAFNTLYEEKWRQIFHKFATPSRIEQCKRVINGALRGLALQKVTERDEEYYRVSVENCKAMMASFYRSDRHPSAGTAAIAASSDRQAVNTQRK